MTANVGHRLVDRKLKRSRRRTCRATSLPSTRDLIANRKNEKRRIGPQLFFLTLCKRRDFLHLF